MTAGSGSASGASAVDTEEFPEGGDVALLRLQEKQGGERCAIGVHASADTAENQEVVVSYDEHGEVVLGPSGSLGGEPSMPRTSPGASVAAEVKAALDWRDRARSCVLSDAPFVCDSGLVWLDAGRHAPLAPLASSPSAARRAARARVCSSLRCVPAFVGKSCAGQSRGGRAADSPRMGESCMPRSARGCC